MITLRQIEAFKAVMDTGMVVKAAKTMHLSQPAVSRLLGDLEACLGYRLFERRKGRLSPRTEAKELYAEVERSFSGLGRIDKAARWIGRKQGGRLRVATLPVFTQAPLPRMTTQLLANSRGIWISVQTRPSEGVIEGVADHQFDLGLTTLPVDHPDVETALLARVPFRCIVRKDHPLAARESVTVEDLIDVGFIAVVEEGCSQQCDEINRVFLEAGAAFKVAMECSTMAFACRLVADGAGAVFGPQFCIDDMMRPFLRAVPFKPEIAADIAVIHTAGRRPGLLGRHFMGSFEEALHQGGGRLLQSLETAQSKGGVATATPH